MFTKDKYSQGFAQHLVIGVTIILTALIIVFLPNKLDTNDNPQPIDKTEIHTPDTSSDATSDEPQNIGTYQGIPSGIDVKEKWKSYISDKHGYEISNPGDWVLYINDFANSDIGLRLKSDETPARHGFSIAVMENPKYKTFKEMCDNGEINDNSGILCSQEITTTVTKIGTISWEKINAGDIGVVPSFDLVLSTYNDNKLYYVVSEGYNLEQITQVLDSFRFVN